MNVCINFISVNGYSMEGVNFKEMFQKVVKVKFFDFIDKIFNSERIIDIIGKYFDKINNEHD